MIWGACFIALFAVIVVIFILLIDCDIVLKCCELFGASPERQLRGKVVWVTGASSGIGECLAYELARCGCKLVLSARRREELERVKERCAEIAAEKFPGTFNKEQDILVVTLDLAQFRTHQQCTEQVLNHFHKVDILVNNAGRSQRALVISTPGIAVEEAMMNVNTLGTISLTKTLLPSMIEKKKGHVVIMSSVAGKIGVPNSASYCANKHALQGYFDSLRAELFGDGINVTTVCPGPVVSKVIENAFTEDVNVMYRDKIKLQGQGKRMPTIRCAELTLVGIASRLDEIWISSNPVLLLTYASQYCPLIFGIVMKRLGLKQVQKLREMTTVEKKSA